MERRKRGKTGLTMWRRHDKACKHKSDRYYPRCSCFVWVEGMANGEPHRHSLRTRSWEIGRQMVADIEAGKKKPKELEQPKGVTIDHALEQFIGACENKRLHPSTLAKYRLFERMFLAHAKARSLTMLAHVSGESISDFRKSRKLGARASGKELERIKRFFRFCLDQEWIEKNPAKNIETPEVDPNPTLPFSEAELQKIFENSSPKESVFYRTLLHSGLRILDAAQLRPERIVNGKLFIYQQKTGHPVFVPLPPDLVKSLSTLPLVGGFYFAVESSKPESIAEYYRKKLHKIQDGFHAHRFRDTFAVDLLLKNVPMETVSILLGHSSIKITEKHYAPWCPARQQKLEDAVRLTWNSKKRKQKLKPLLVRVK